MPEQLRYMNCKLLGPALWHLRKMNQCIRSEALHLHKNAIGLDAAYDGFLDAAELRRHIADGPPKATRGSRASCLGIAGICICAIVLRHCLCHYQELGLMSPSFEHRAAASDVVLKDKQGGAVMISMSSDSADTFADCLK